MINRIKNSNCDCSEFACFENCVKRFVVGIANLVVLPLNLVITPLTCLSGTPYYFMLGASMLKRDCYCDYKLNRLSE